jgi:hypothetical protein
MFLLGLSSRPVKDWSIRQKSFYGIEDVKLGLVFLTLSLICYHDWEPLYCCRPIGSSSNGQLSQPVLFLWQLLIYTIANIWNDVAVVQYVFEVKDQSNGMKVYSNNMIIGFELVWLGRHKCKENKRGMEAYCFEKWGAVRQTRCEVRIMCVFPEIPLILFQSKVVKRIL